MSETRYCVDGHEYPHPESYLLGDGEYPPFRVFDIEDQQWVGPEYPTRTAAQQDADLRNRFDTGLRGACVEALPEDDRRVALTLARAVIAAHAEGFLLVDHAVQGSGWNNHRLHLDLRGVARLQGAESGGTVDQDLQQFLGGVSLMYAYGVRAGWTPDGSPAAHDARSQDAVEYRRGFAVGVWLRETLTGLGIPMGSGRGLNPGWDPEAHRRYRPRKGPHA